MQGVIGDFPGCMADILRVSNKDELKQDAAVVRMLMRKLLTCLSRLHVSCGCVQVFRCRPYLSSDTSGCCGCCGRKAERRVLQLVRLGV